MIPKPKDPDVSPCTLPLALSLWLSVLISAVWPDGVAGMDHHAGWEKDGGPVRLAHYVGNSADASDSLLAQGNRFYQQGEYEAAVEAYRTILENGLESGSLHYNLGNAYFKSDQLGMAILAWERARRFRPGNPDLQANLALARTLTVDVIEPLPRFWLFAVLDWWVSALPDQWLALVVALAWIATAVGVQLVILLDHRPRLQRVARTVAITGGLAVVLFGTSFLAREFSWGQPTRAVVLAEAVAVRSAPRADDDLTLFEVHEGTTVRLDGRAPEWVKIVLADGKVGWLPAEALEEI